jgi:hypothetical protein
MSTVLERIAERFRPPTPEPEPPPAEPTPDQEAVAAMQRIAQHEARMQQRTELVERIRRGERVGCHHDLGYCTCTCSRSGFLGDNGLT